MIIADTDVLIDFLNDTGLADRVAEELETGSLTTTAISRFELLSGARTQRQRKIIEALLNGLTTLPLDQAAADDAAVVRRALESRGVGIGMADSLIAGIVRVNDGVLLTRNIEHFDPVEGLSISPAGRPR